MKISLSTLIGILLIAGALVFHFLGSKPASPHPANKSAKSANFPKSAQSKPFQVYSRHDLKALAPAARFTTLSQAYLQAEGLIRSHQKQPAPERHQALLQVLALLYRIQREDPAWETELISKRIEQTIIALLAAQRTFEKSAD